MTAFTSFSPRSLLMSAILLCFFARGFGQTQLTYRFRVEPKNAMVHVTLECKGDASGRTVLQLPDKWAGQTELYRAVRSVSVSGKGASVTMGEDSSRRVVTHKPNATLTVDYALRQDWNGDLDYPDNFRAVIQPGFFQFTGYSLFIVPEMDDAERVAVKLDWSRLPENWTVANSLHTGSRKYKGKLQLENLINAVYVAGDFRLYETSVRKKPVFVAIRGNGWQFADTMLVNRIETILAMERTFWNDFSEPYYFVSLLPFVRNGSRNGTSLHQAFMLGMTDDVTVNSALDWLLTHEYFHRWNGTLIRLTETIQQENSWFSEGFTEYYSYKLLWENGIYTFDEYIQNVNKMIADYYLSPVRNEDKATLGRNYWETPEFQQIPYKKGFVYALYLDHLIRSASDNRHSLDNVMFDLRDSKTPGELTDSIFVELVSNYAGQDIRQLQRLYIDSGETIPVLAGSIPNTDLTTGPIGVFDVGFDTKASWDTKTITGVKPGSEAWKAGLRDGQTVKGYSIYNGDLTHPAEIGIEENGEMKTISYIPVSAERTDVPQFKIR